jgi:DNA (cytosine-5)-methyltransferase 1
LPDYKFIDLFAGIGGFHLALHSLGAECVFASEWDEAARKTYEHNFSKISPNLFNAEQFAGDITKINKKDIPDFDILCGGFPCQPFSQAGHRLGFEDTRGTLFFDIAEILRIKQPKAFFIENVRGLFKHDDGKTFQVISNTITKDLGYSLHYAIVKASDHGLPQHRPRLFMVGFRDPDVPFTIPFKTPLEFTMSDVMNGHVDREIGFTLRVGGGRSPIDDRRNWDGYVVNGEVRRLTPDEGKRMQGFPETFEFPVSNAEALKQLGNSVAINAIRAWGQEIFKSLDEYYKK